MIHTAASVIAASLVASSPAQPYEPTWESISQHEAAPEWFRDAKFGIYFHWGVYSVPAFGSEWYPRHMHMTDRNEYRHHVETYGEPDEFGYHDFVPMFKAEQFDAEEWAELFAQAGARYAGPVGEHHDGFAMWDSNVTPWNVADMGPKRDISGELAAAVRERGMRFVMTFHHARNQGHYPRVDGWPTTSEDPELLRLYANMDRSRFLDQWLAKLRESIDKYHPDIIWFDSWLNEIPEKYQLDYLAHHLNDGAARGEKVVVTCKQRDLPVTIAVEDFEKGRADRLTDLVWLTDDTISDGSWCYTQNLRIKPAHEVIHVLIDIVSKNGNLLLNISPKADGTIPGNQRAVLLAIGAWLEAHGEAIYDTRPWLTYGEGPTRLGGGGHFLKRVEYSAGDIRYTQRKDGSAVYATFLGAPEARATLGAVQVRGDTSRASATLVGSGQAIPFSVGERGNLMLDFSAVPDSGLREVATAVRLDGFDLTLHDDSRFAGPNAIELSAANATLDGDRLHLENLSDELGSSVGFWDNPSDSVHWLVRVPEAGRYDVRGLIAAGAGDSAITLHGGLNPTSASVSATEAWNAPRVVEIGEIEFDSPGVHHLVLRPQSNETWRAVNIWHLKLARSTGR